LGKFRRLSATDARIIADALYAVAEADGQVDPREVEVIVRFLRDCSAPETMPGDGIPAAAALSKATEGLRDSFLCACAMLAFADGDFTAEEAVLLRRYAGDIGVPLAHLEELVSLVEREQAVPPAPPPPPRASSSAAWGREHLPHLREKVMRLFAPAQA
jgi:uncharacterized tellurite resistance protein B-like protein